MIEDLGTATHPKFTSAQIATIETFGERRSIAQGEVLITEGTRQNNFYVILSGELEVLQHQDNREIPIITHSARGMIGEIATLTGEVAMVEVRANSDAEVIAVPPENLHRIVVEHSELSDVILRSFLLRRAVLLKSEGYFKVVGTTYSQETFQIREFLSRNGYPYTFLDVERDDGVARLLDELDIGADELPIVITRDNQVYKRPSIRDMARCLGLRPALDNDVFDVIVVGAGSAGLAASVYAASEGLRVLALDSIAPGGQASRSSKIENYLGFPTGISGEDLARSALVQARKFGAGFSAPATATGLSNQERLYSVAISGEEQVRAKTVVIASGVQYRRPDIPGCAEFEGRGVYYAATPMEAQMCRNTDVIVVGGGNSAGQAAVFLSNTSRKVYILIRKGDLSASMSRYLIRRIEEIPNVELLAHTGIAAMEGDGRLEHVRVRNNQTEETENLQVNAVFLMIGADPNVGWLDGQVATDMKGFVKTGLALSPEELKTCCWPTDRQPMLLETNKPGVFAAGDVRSGSTKRVASAVGEGSICVQMIHQYLQLG
jgi:thioredoxin reductase (NADPH)